MRRQPAATGNAGDAEQVHRAGRRDQRRVDRRQTLLARQMATADGREFVWQELERHGLHDRVLSLGGDMQATALFLGRREAGLDLFIELRDYHSDAYLAMYQEAIVRAKRDTAELEGAQSGRSEPEE